MLKEYFKISIRNLMRRKIRSWLTMLGIFIGIASVVALISLGQGLSNAIDEQFEKMGRDKIMVMASGGSTFMGMGYDVLDKDDIKLIENIAGVNKVSAFLYKTDQVEYKNEFEYTFIMGFPTDDTKEVIESMQNWKIIEGRDLDDTDKYKVVVGCEVIKNNGLFKNGVKTRENIKIIGKDFRVVGVISCQGNKQDDTQLYIPLDTARDLFDEPTKVDTIFVQVKKGFLPSLVAEKIEDKMRKDRDLDEGEENFQVQTSEQLMETFGSILMIIEVVLAGIAAISLIVGGIGIMNTMYTAVLERTREIGVMKAIGARRRNILSIFLIESGLMGAVGGIIGVVFGMLISYGVAYAAKMFGFSYLSIKINPWLILFGIMFAFVLGSLAGVLPAIRATKLQAVDALRYE